MKVSDARSCVNLWRLRVNFVIKNLFKATFVGSPLIICQQRHFRFVWMSSHVGRKPLCTLHPQIHTSRTHQATQASQASIFIYLWSFFHALLHVIHFLYLCDCFFPFAEKWYMKLTNHIFLHSSPFLLFFTPRPSMICSVHALRISPPTRPRREPRISSQKWMKTTMDN